LATLDQADSFRFSPNTLRIQAGTIILYFDYDMARIVISIQADRTLGWLTLLCAHFWPFNAVIQAVAH